MHLHQGVGEEFTALVPAIAVETGTHLERAWFARDLDPIPTPELPRTPHCNPAFDPGTTRIFPHIPMLD
jgi:hypothetical protein